jgi:voltage-dependent potassium channel beta subunit
MEYRYLGKSGLQVSALSLGAWVTYGGQVGEETAHQCMEAAFKAGVNFFDNAEAYADGEAEIVMGKVIKKAGWKRSDLVISTKIFWGGRGPNDSGLSRKHIIEGTLTSLERLQLEYIDLIFCHRADIHTPIEETVRAMTHLIDQGKAFYWGTSEWSPDKIMEAHAVARREHLIPPLMEQPEYNMFNRKRIERHYAHLYQEIGLGTTIWSPLDSGILTGKYNQGIPKEEGKEKLDKVGRLMPIAEELGCTMAQLALAWCLVNPNVSTVITGASRPEQVVENMASLEVVPKLNDKILERIEEILDNKPKPEPDFR